MKQPVFYLLTLISLLFSANAFSQSWLWAREPIFAGNPPTQSDGEGYSVATDKEGNVYQTGYFSYASVTYGSQVLTSIGGTAFLVKYNSAGVVQWATQAKLQNLSSDCAGYFVATDVSGNAYVTGFFNDTVSFGNITLTSSNGGEVFLAKYSPNGNVLWVRQSTKSAFNGNYNYGLGVSTDLSGNVYVTGQFENTTTFGLYSLVNPPGTPNQYDAEGDVFLVKYDSLGNVVWARQGTPASNASFGTARAVCTDAFSNVFITGAFFDTITFGTQTLISPSGAGEIFTAKYDKNGNFLWARQTLNNSLEYSGNGAVFGNAITTDKTGNVYITGNFEDTIYFGATELVNPIAYEYSFTYGTMLMAKYSPDGNLVWAKQADPLTNGTYTSWGVTTDTFNHLYVETSGWNVYSATRLPFVIKFGADTFTTTGIPSYECALLTELDTDGNVLCGSIIPVGGDENSGLAVDPSGKYIYEGSDFMAQNNVIIGPDTLSIENNSSNPGIEIPYILRWQPCVVAMPLSVSLIDTNTSCNGPCNGKAIANPSGGTPPYSYSWNTNPVDTTAIIMGLCAGHYLVTVTDKTGSTVTSGVTVTQLLPIPGLTTGDTLICNGDSSQICAPDNYTTYNWSTGATGTCIEAKSAGGYWLTVTNADGCSAVSNHMNISVYPIPQSISIVEQGDTLSTFGATSYQWYLNNEPISNATNAIYIAGQSGYYAVDITDTNGCKQLSSNTYVQVTGIAALEINDGLNIYPNPFNGVIFIRMNNLKAGVMEIEVLNVLGETVINREITGVVQNLVTIDAFLLPEGVYYLRVKTADGDFTKEMIKE